MEKSKARRWRSHEPTALLPNKNFDKDQTEIKVSRARFIWWLSALLLYLVPMFMNL